MGYSYKFADNVSYGAEDVNSVINEFVTAGVADVFFDGTSYNTSDLNKIAASFSTGGIKYTSSTSCKAIKYSSGSVKILEGTAFFNDGSIIKIDSDGVILSYAAGKKNYVYLKGNINAENKNEVCCSLTPGVGDVVQIAVIDESGNITDTREFCRGKIAGYQSTFSKPKRITLEYSLIGGTGACQDFTYDLDGYGYSHIIDISLKERSMKGDSNSPVAFGIYDIANNFSMTLCHRLDRTSVYSRHDNAMLIYPCYGSTSSTDADIFAYFEIENTVLKVHVVLSNTISTTYKHEGTVTFLVI